MKWKNQYPDNHCFFITSSVVGFLPILDMKGIPEMLLGNLDKCRSLFKFKLFGYVIMPEHWHILAHFTKGKDCLAFARDYKRFSAEAIISILEKDKGIETIEYFRANANGKAKYSVWKEQARVIPLTRMSNIKAKLDYIHNNPVKRGLANAPAEYSLSSARYYLGGGSGQIKIDAFEGIV